MNLLRQEPHTGGLQVPTSRQLFPGEVRDRSPTVVNVHTTPQATVIPESAASGDCAIDCRVFVVITITRGEHHAVVIAECVKAGVTRVPSYLKLIVKCLWQYYETTVLGEVPVAGVAT